MAAAAKQISMEAPGVAVLSELCERAKKKTLLGEQHCFHFTPDWLCSDSA